MTSRLKVRSPKRPGRHDCWILGKVIGTMSCWSQIGDDAFLIERLKLNLLGKHWLPDFVDGRDLVVFFMIGETTEWLPGENPDDEGIMRESDWSVFR